MLLVTGVPGKTGSATAEALLKYGAKVAVLVRSEGKAATFKGRGAEVVVGSLDDVPSLTAALRGKEGVFLMIPPAATDGDYIAERRRLVKGYAEAVRESGVPHVVFLSSIGAERSEGTGLILSNHLGEEALRPAAKSLTILRASSFLENWGEVASYAKEQGILPTFYIPKRKLAHISTKDIGAFAAEALLHPAEGERIWYISGPFCSPEDIAQVFSDVLGKPVWLDAIADTQAAAVMKQQGASESMAQNFEEMTRAVNAGLIELPAHAQIRSGPTTAQEVIAELVR